MLRKTLTICSLIGLLLTVGLWVVISFYATGILYLNVGFTNELDWIWFELWHHEGRRMRHGAAMMGPDFTHWHGSYEVSKHFYMKFLPKIEALAEKHNDATLKKLIQDEVFSTRMS